MIHHSHYYAAQMKFTKITIDKRKDIGQNFFFFKSYLSLFSVTDYLCNNYQCTNVFLKTRNLHDTNHHIKRKCINIYRILQFHTFTLSSVLLSLSHIFTVIFSDKGLDLEQLEGGGRAWGARETQQGNLNLRR